MFDTPSFFSDEVSFLSSDVAVLPSSSSCARSPYPCQVVAELGLELLACQPDLLVLIYVSQTSIEYSTNGG